MTRHRGLDLAQVEIHVITALLSSSIAIRTASALGDKLSSSGHGCSSWFPWCNFTASTRTMPARWPRCWRTFVRCSGNSTSSVLLVHHTRKNTTGGAAAGVGLRGSSNIHAFGDSNLYLRRAKEHLVLSTEHRAARGIAAHLFIARHNQSRYDSPKGRRQHEAVRPGTRTESHTVSRSECWIAWPAAWCSRDRSSVTALRSRMSVWARCSSRWSVPAG